MERVDPAQCLPSRIERRFRARTPPTGAASWARSDQPNPAASRGFIRGKHIGAALLVICGVYSGGLLALGAPALYARNTGLIAKIIRAHDADAILEPARLEYSFAQASFPAMLPVEIPGISIALQQTRSRAEAARAFATAILRRATGGVLAASLRATTSAARPESATPEIAGVSGERRVVATSFTMRSGASAFGARIWSFGETQKVLSADEAAALAEDPAKSCGGLSAGRWDSRSNHGRRGLNSGFFHRASALPGTGIRIPVMNWKWCGL